MNWSTWLKTTDKFIPDTDNAAKFKPAAWTTHQQGEWGKNLNIALEPFLVLRNICITNSGETVSVFETLSFSIFFRKG
jgi:hypothetical protein